MNRCANVIIDGVSDKNRSIINWQSNRSCSYMCFVYIVIINIHCLSPHGLKSHLNIYFFFVPTISSLCLRLIYFNNYAFRSSDYASHVISCLIHKINESFSTFLFLRRKPEAIQHLSHNKCYISFELDTVIHAYIRSYGRLYIYMYVYML